MQSHVAPPRNRRALVFQCMLLLVWRVMNSIGKHRGTSHLNSAGNLMVLKEYYHGCKSKSLIAICELGRWGNSAMFVVALLFPLPHPACKVFSPQPSVPSILIGSLRYQDITLRRSDAPPYGSDPCSFMSESCSLLLRVGRRRQKC